MQETYGDRVDFVGVPGLDDVSAINEFIDTLGVGAFEHAVDRDGSLWAEYGITMPPSFVFIDDAGETTTHVGTLGVEGLTEVLDHLVS